ncbi:MAG: hypothetical protein KA275_09375 [Chitinophagaceae bacterium]|nr:hypothetical protein [Chitinophagaceae bacterium]
MKNKFTLFSILTSLLFIFIISISSCNTYRWQRKRFYNSDPNKNWNNYHKKDSLKSKNNIDSEIQQYYRKEK